MVVIPLTVLVALTICMMLISKSVLLRSIYLKLMADVAAILVLGLGGTRDDGILRALGIIIIVLGLGISFIFFITPKGEAKS